MLKTRGRFIALAAGVAAIAAIGALSWSRVGPWWRERAMRSGPRPVDVLLVTLDTTRADRLGAYGWARAETPNLDALARRGTMFRQAFAHVPLTTPSHASFFSGLLPTRHGVRDNGSFVMPASAPLLAERFREGGYQTAAFVSAFVLDRRFGLARGFETYDDDVPGASGPGGDPSERSVRAEETIGKALAWLAGKDRRPRFLWVHLYDPHAPYDPPEPYASRHRENAYDGEVAYMDAQVGRLLAALPGSEGRSWLTVMAGDHGEGLGDHDEVTHGYFVYGNTQRVPLIVSLPRRVPAGRAIDTVVRGIDVAPTILELSGLPALPDADGRSLVRLMAGRADAAPGPAYLESFHPRLWWGAQELLALRTDRWLFIDAPRPELYDTIADPGERTNLAATRSEEREALLRQLRQYARPGMPIGAQSRPDAEAEARLRALGYVGSSSASAVTGDLADAKDNGPLLRAVSQGHELAGRGRHAEALEYFREALRRNPRAMSVRSSIADTLLTLGRNDEAFQAFADLAAAGAMQDAAYVGMSKARLAQQRSDEALKVAEAGLKVAADSVLLNAHLGEVLLQEGRLPEAERAFRRALKAGPTDAAARWGLGVSLSKQGRRQESVEVLLRLAEDSPRSAEARRAAEALEIWADERLEAGAAPEARRGYEAAIRAGRASEAIFLNAGLATWRSGLQAEALDVLQRAESRFPSSPDILYRKGRILQQLGRLREAAAAFRRVLELAPGHPGATAALQGR